MGLLGPQLTFLPAEVVAPAPTAPVGVRGISGAAGAADLVEEPVPLCKLLLHHISNRHRSSAGWDELP